MGGAKMRGDWDSGEGMTGKTIGVRDLGCLALKKLGGGSNNYSSSLSAYSSIPVSYTHLTLPTKLEV